MGTVTLQCRDHVAPGIVESLQSVAVDFGGLRSASAKLLEERRGDVRGGAAGMPNQRQIEIAAKERLVTKPVAILRVKCGCICRAERTGRIV
jgi:hypothetical protein